MAGEELVVLDHPRLPLAVGDVEHRSQEVREGLVGSEDAEVPLLLVQLGHVAQELAEDERILGVDGAGRRDVHRMDAKVRHPEVAQQGAAVGMGIGAHPPLALGRELGELRDQAAAGVEQLLGLVASHPALELLDVLGMLGIDEQRHLVRPEGPLDLQAVDHLRSGPALGGPEDDHRPARPRRVLPGPRVLLDLPDVQDHRLDGLGHQLVHRFRLVALDEIGRPAAAPEELLEFLVLDAGQHGRIADLEAVEMQDRQHGAVGDRIEELVGLPRGRQGTRLRLAIADHAGDDQLRIVERGPESMAERIAELPAFMDRARRGRRDMAGDAARKGELLEQPLHPGLVLADVRVDLAVAALEIGVADQRRPAVAGAGNIEHVEVVFLDDPVQMHIDEVLAGRRAPVADHQGLDMGERQRLAQQWVVVQVDLSDRQIVGRAPVGVDPAQLVGFYGCVMPVDGRAAARRTLQRRGRRAHSRYSFYPGHVCHAPPQESSEEHRTTSGGDRPEGSCCPASPAGSETTQTAQRSARRHR